ncbi:MAG TPA: hypothetical protein VK465_18535, partial [Fibrobacteria bacterium]|nr:hypothetical protein [Fibrobacteria bacterium]
MAFSGMDKTPAAAKAKSAGKVETWESPLEGGMPIHFGHGAVDMLPDLLTGLKADKLFIISDSRTFPLHGANLLQLLSSHFAPEILLIPEGEAEKKMSNLEALCGQLFERGVTKSSVV